MTRQVRDYGLEVITNKSSLHAKLRVTDILRRQVMETMGEPPSHHVGNFPSQHGSPEREVMREKKHDRSASREEDQQVKRRWKRSPSHSKLPNERKKHKKNKRPQLSSSSETD